VSDGTNHEPVLGAYPDEVSAKLKKLHNMTFGTHSWDQWARELLVFMAPPGVEFLAPPVQPSMPAPVQQMPSVGLLDPFCPDCMSTGQVNRPGGGPCPRCNGRGRVPAGTVDSGTIEATQAALAEKMAQDFADANKSVEDAQHEMARFDKATRDAAIKRFNEIRAEAEANERRRKEEATARR